jgi:hypothetical protein
MNRDDIIRMAQEAGYVYHVSGGTGTYVQFYWDQLEQFANLIAAAERERIKWDTIHSCHPECDKPVCVAMRKAVLEEREACAQIAHDTYEGFGPHAKGVDFVKQHIAIRIRERGAP